MKTQLLCTFTDTEELTETINKIVQAYEVVFNKIYVFEDKNNNNELACTYNVDVVNLGAILPGTISLHRKKQTNTLYTINAINEVIKELNGGKLDRKYPIPWNNYYNTMLVTNSGGLITIKTKLHKIIETQEWEKTHTFIEGSINAKRNNNISGKRFNQYALVAQLDRATDF